MTVRDSSSVGACGAILACCLALGCGQEPIRSYRVARLEPLTTSQTAVRGSPSATTSGERVPVRMVAAVAQRPEAMWVFKIMGPPEDVSSTETAWRTFIQSVTFDDASQLPRWTLPEGWQERPGNAFRHATLLIPGVEPPLELAISRLPPGQDLLMNVNRWRGQLELESLPADQLDSQLEKLVAGPETFLLLDASGFSNGSMTGVGPMASQSSANTANKSSVEATDAELPFEFTAPDQWDIGPTTQFTLRRFMRTDGSRTVQLAITRLPSAAQSWNDTVGVWCGELGLPPLPAEQVAELTQDRSVDGRSARMILLKSEADRKASQILHWSTETDSWYIKLTGDASLVEESLATFDQFVDSIRFKPQT